MKSFLPVLAGLLIALSAQAQQDGSADPVLQRADLMTGLENPWDLAITQDGLLFFTEKCRGLSLRRADGSVTRLFGTRGSAQVAKDFFCEGQSGMNGVALDPDFAENRTLYVYMPSELGGTPNNRVVRLRLDEGFTQVTERDDVLTGISFKARANAVARAGAHSGGRIRFGPDGFLYVPTGDNHNGPLPQDLTRLGGKVLRVDRNGEAAPGNNTPAGGDPRIFTYGHRNVQGIDFHPETGQPFIAEHGPGHSDEVTALVAGGNGGWDPVPAQGVSCPDDYCGYISNRRDGTLTSMTDLEKFPGAMKPVHVFEDSDGLGPLVFLSGSQWRSWESQPVVGFMRGARVNVLVTSEAGEIERVIRADLPEQRMRALVQGPQGRLYIATDEGAIWVVEPQRPAASGAAE
ncbi:MAG: PQQ-dependent sugar dehydrogenase [Thiohalobacteraceae bacterium]